MRIVFVCVVCGLFSLSAWAENIKPFKSDGCSLFPDGHLLARDAWCNCCVEHDIAYWQGGTEAQKEQADIALRDCVLQTTGNELLAEGMYRGVKYGGHPVFPNWYRWGYGWPYGRGFKALDTNEQHQVSTQLRFIDHSCPDWLE